MQAHEGTGHIVADARLPAPGPLTIARLARVAGFRSAQRPQGDDDVIDADPLFCVLLGNVGQQFRLTW